MASFISAVGLVVLSTVLGSFGALMLKKGSGRFSLKTLLSNHTVILGFVLYFFSTIVFIPSLKVLPVSIAYPITSLSYIWTVILSVFFLKEKVERKKLAAILLIIIGVILVGMSK